jgi:hypothetical protein
MPLPRSDTLWRQYGLALAILFAGIVAFGASIATLFFN